MDVDLVYKKWIKISEGHTSPIGDKAVSVMKFIIIFNICSQLYGTCLPPTTHSDIYATHYECATTGYGIAQSMMAQMGQDYVNNNRIVIGFKCEPKMDI